MVSFGSMEKELAVPLFELKKAATLSTYTRMAVIFCAVGDFHRRSHRGIGGGEADLHTRTSRHTRTRRSSSGNGEGFGGLFRNTRVIPGDDCEQVTAGSQSDVIRNRVARNRQLRHVVDVNTHGRDGAARGRRSGGGNMHGRSHAGPGSGRTDRDHRGFGHWARRLHGK